MTPLEQLIVRSWSALTSRGEPADAEAIALRIGVDVAVVHRRMVEMRVKGQLPEAVSA